MMLVGHDAPVRLSVVSHDADLGVQGQCHSERVETRAEVRRGRRDADGH
jgi:hypothetical protein